MEGVRQYPRYKVTLPVQLCSPIDHVPVRAQVADICLGGCYVELSFTKEVSAEVELTMWIGDAKFSAAGVVVSSHPSFGNGIKFTRLAEDSKTQLQKLIEQLETRSLLRRVW